jgi:hypothetical protein
MTAFIAHDVASWVGVPTAAVIVAMVMLRKWGKGRQARRQEPTALDSSREGVTSQSR